MREETTMQFPIQYAADSLRGKPPAELPHGLLAIPPVARELVEEELVKHPQTSADHVRWMLNYGTIDFYFEGLNQEVIYRETLEGPEVMAVGFDEIHAFRQGKTLDEQRKYETYLGY
jgi:hypothetical protein